MTTSSLHFPPSRPARLSTAYLAAALSLALIAHQPVAAFGAVADAVAPPPTRAFSVSGACTVTAPELGLAFDLASVGSVPVLDSHQPPWTYFTSVCAPLAPNADARVPATCAATLGADGVQLDGAAYVYQFESGGACHRISGADAGAGASMLPDTKRFGLQFVFAGGDACARPGAGAGIVNRLARVSLECYNGRVPISTVEETGLCEYSIAIRHPAACPLGCPRAAAGNVCSGRSHGACIKDPATGAPLCSCAGGFSGRACEVAPAAPPVQPSAEPSPPALPRSSLLVPEGGTYLQEAWSAAPHLTPAPSRAGTALSSALFPGASALVFCAVAAIALVYLRLAVVRSLGRSRAIAACAAALCGAFFVWQQASPLPAHSLRLPSYRCSGALSAPLLPPLPSLVSRRPPISSFNRDFQRVFVRTFEIKGGGPHCLASCAWTLSQVLGVRGTHTTKRTPMWDSRYTANITLVGEGTVRGDIVLNHEYFESQPHPDSGIKQFILELGDVPLQAAHSASKFAGHSFYTRDFVRSPAVALLRQFVHPAQWPNVPARPGELRGVKENLVLVDDEGPNGVLVMLKQRLAPRWPDLEVVELKGFSSDELASLFRRAKVYVDGGMRGMERTAQEAMLFFVVPVLEFGRNGQNEFDYPLPTSLKYDLARNEKDGNVVQNRMADVEARVEAVLGDWWGALNRIDINRRLLLSHPQLAAIDMARLIAATLHVHVLACSPFMLPPDNVSDGAVRGGGGSGPDGGGHALAGPRFITLSAYLVATALHYVSPAASSTLHSGLEAGELEADAAELLLATRSTAGTLAFTRVADSSPLCAPSNGPSAPNESAWLSALAHAHFGNSDVAAALSWRALPLQPTAITAWQDALRASSAQYSTLVLRGVLLGVLFKLDGATGSDSIVRPPRLRVMLDAAGAIVLSGPGVVDQPLVWEDNGLAADAGDAAGALPRGLWADLRRIAAYGVPRVSGMDADPPALDQAIALQESGLSWDDLVTSVEARDHAAAARLYRARDRHGGAYLCGHVDFRRIAGFTPHATDLCVGDAVVSIL